MKPSKKNFSASCPIPIAQYPQVMLAHGGGGKLMHQLIEKIFMPAFKNTYLESQHDGAVVTVQGQRIALTTDSYVVHPLFFPGGDIGSMAVFGTVNDLAMCGAKPLFLTAGFILEEGLPMETLWRVVQSMRAAAKASGVTIVTGDTKVVDKGKGDGLFVNTAGIGVVQSPGKIMPASVRPGDAILLSGDVGRHGMAVMALREGLQFESEITSDCAPVASMVLALLKAGIRVHCLRDLTRGGLANALVEIAQAAKVGMEIEEGAIPVIPPVKNACEILGLDPLYVACEGRFIAFVADNDADRACRILRKHAEGKSACRIGSVSKARSELVTLRSSMGTSRILDMLSGEQLPRIC